MKLWRFVVTSLAGLTLVPAYWMVEPEIAVDQPKVTIITQGLGDAVSIDVPASDFASQLPDFYMYTEVRDRSGFVVRETDPIAYQPDMSYKFVTYSKLGSGRYEASVVLNYRLNPLRQVDTRLPLAIIYVEH